MEKIQSSREFIADMEARYEARKVSEGDLTLSALRRVSSERDAAVANAKRRKRLAMLSVPVAAGLMIVGAIVAWLAR